MLAPTSAARIALLVTSLIGDTKGEHYFESATEAMDEAVRLIGWPDTLVYVFDTTSTGERAATPFAVISRESGWQSLLPVTDQE